MSQQEGLHSFRKLKEEIYHSLKGYEWDKLDDSKQKTGIKK